MREIKFIAFCVALLGLFVAYEANSADFYQFTDANGTLTFTDDAERVPTTAEEVTERTWEEVREASRARMTPVETPTQHIHVPTPELVEARANPNREVVCGRPVTVTSERRQFDDLNREVFIVHDECGRIVSETFDQPEIRILR